MHNFTGALKTEVNAKIGGVKNSLPLVYDNWMAENIFFCRNRFFWVNNPQYLSSFVVLKNKMGFSEISS